MCDSVKFCVKDVEGKIRGKCGDGFLIRCFKKTPGVQKPYHSFETPSLQKMTFKPLSRYTSRAASWKIFDEAIFMFIAMHNGIIPTSISSCTLQNPFLCWRTMHLTKSDSGTLCNDSNDVDLESQRVLLRRVPNPYNSQGRERERKKLFWGPLV